MEKFLLIFFFGFFISLLVIPQFHYTFAAPAEPPCAPNSIDSDGRCTAVMTAFGKVGVEPGEFISRLFGILLAAAGSIAVILFMRAGYQIMTARGNPEGIKEGREKIVAAIVGLMFLIFSFVILQVIGVDLLKIPISR